MQELDPFSPAEAEAAPLSALNEAQLQAVETVEGPVLVLAGAGTGKTRVLTARLAHILGRGLAYPSQILAVTFTNKAAREMRLRLERMVGENAGGLWLGTFHAIGARILRRHAELLGLSSNFTILDTDDQLRLLKQLLAAEKIDDKRWPARALLAVIQRWKDRGLTPDKVPVSDAGEFASGRAQDLYRQYQDRLRTLNAVDFGDLTLHNLTLFTTHADILAEYQRRFRYVLVDEYQDTNLAQYLWLRLLAQQSRNLCCVGDDDQSIYSWRGAEIGNILRFEQDFPGAAIIRLEENYRSTPHILAAASHLIANNRDRLGKTLWTEAQEGEKVRLRAVWDAEAEARWAGDEIEALQRKGHRLAEIAILVRASAQTREFEERFISLGLPYRVIGGLRFYERQEIRDALAYLRLINQPADDLAFERIVNLPRRGIGDQTIQTVRAHARDAEIPMTHAAERLLGTDEMKPAARRALSGFLKDLARWQEAAHSLPHAELAKIVLDESGYTGMWQADKSIEAPGRLENLKELVAAMAEFENLGGFLEHVGLVMETATVIGADMINIMTLHAAKGLEFETVFLPGWEEGLFPNQRSLDENGLAALEEERRLAYVGITRARLRANISFAANRQIYGKWQSAIPSRFIEELPEEHIEVLAEQGLRPNPGFAPRQHRLETRAAPAPISRASSSALYRPGERVFHQKFGQGTVKAADDDRLLIAFDQAGEKKVMASFVRKG